LALKGQTTRRIEARKIPRPIMKSAITIIATSSPAPVLGSCVVSAATTIEAVAPEATVWDADDDPADVAIEALAVEELELLLVVDVTCEGEGLTDADEVEQFSVGFDGSDVHVLEQLGVAPLGESVSPHDGFAVPWL
jgi:hypothetical protein